jgi:hypothetical protein
MDHFRRQITNKSPQIHHSSTSSPTNSSTKSWNTFSTTVLQKTSPWTSSTIDEFAIYFSTKAFQDADIEKVKFTLYKDMLIELSSSFLRVDRRLNGNIEYGLGQAFREQEEEKEEREKVVEKILKEAVREILKADRKERRKAEIEKRQEAERAERRSDGQAQSVHNQSCIL